MISSRWRRTIAATGVVAVIGTAIIPMSAASAVTVGPGAIEVRPGDQSGWFLATIRPTRSPDPFQPGTETRSGWVTTSDVTGGSVFLDPTLTTEPPAEGGVVYGQEWGYETVLANGILGGTPLGRLNDLSLLVNRNQANISDRPTVQVRVDLNGTAVDPDGDTCILTTDIDTQAGTFVDLDLTGPTQRWDFATECAVSIPFPQTWVGVRATILQLHPNAEVDAGTTGFRIGAYQSDEFNEGDLYVAAASLDNTVYDFQPPTLGIVGRPPTSVVAPDPYALPLPESGHERVTTNFKTLDYTLSGGNAAIGAYGSSAPGSPNVLEWRYQGGREAGAELNFTANPPDVCRDSTSPIGSPIARDVVFEAPGTKSVSQLNLDAYKLTQTDNASFDVPTSAGGVCTLTLSSPNNVDITPTSTVITIDSATLPASLQNPDDLPLRSLGASEELPQAMDLGTPLVAPAGGTVNVHVTRETAPNQGNDRGIAWPGTGLKAAIYDIVPTNDEPRFDLSTSGLSISSNGVVSGTLTLPSSLTPGSRYLIAISYVSYVGAQPDSLMTQEIRIIRGDGGDGDDEWPNTERLFGQDRYGTAVDVATKRFNSANVEEVLIATGADYPDALAASPLGAEGRPLLLVRADSIPDVVADYLDSLPNLNKIWLFGGSGVVNAAVEAQLGDFADVQRVFGADRYETAANIALEVVQPNSVVYVASGLDFPDALGAASAVASDGAALLLTQSNQLPAATADALDELGVNRVVVVGGSGVISDAVLDQIEDVLGVGGTVERVFGADRYATAAAVNALAFPGEAPVVYLPTGENWPDALTGAAAAAFDDAPIALARAACLPAPTLASIEQYNPDTIYVVGGTGVVSDAAAAGTPC